MRKINKIRLFVLEIVLFFLLLPIVYATDFTEDMKSCWNWDGDATDDYGSWDGSVTGATNTLTYGWLGEGSGAYHFTGDDSIAIGGDDKNFNSYGNATILVCTNTTVVEESSGNMLSADGDDLDRSLSIYLYNGMMVFNDNQGGYGDTVTLAADGRIRCIILTWNTSSTTKKMYINGILNATDTSSDSYDATVQVYFGRRLRSTFGWFTGWIGISAEWENKTFSTAEVFELYTNLQTGGICPTFEGVTEELTTTATDLYDGGTISNFTVILSNTTDTYINSTTTGEINWNNISSGLYDIKFISNQSGGYFNISFDDFDVSSDLAAEMFQSVLILNATDLTDVSQIIGFTVTVPLQINHSNSSGLAKLLLKAGEYTVIGNESNHLNVTKTISVAALETKFETLEFGSKHLHINATDITTGIKLSTFNVLLEDLNSDFTGNVSTTSGDATFSLEAGNFTITVSATDYTTLVENVTVDTIHTNHTSNLQKENTILINIFAEGNQSILNWTNVTASFDSDTSVFSSKSDNGTIYLEDVTPEEYTITFSASGFDSRDYFINLIPGSNVHLDAYLIDSAESTEITFTIVDASTSINLDGVLVSVSKKINLSFLTIAQKESDISGVVVFDLDQSIIYRFTLSKTEFETRTFDLTPTSTTYTIELTPESVIDYTTIYDRIDFTLLPLNTTLRTGTIVDFSIIASSLDGTVIDYFGVNSTFNGTNFITNISTSPAGGTATIQLNFDNFIGSAGVTYFIDVDGFDPVRIDKNFYVSNVTPGNMSISSVIDLFDDELGESKQGRLLKAIIAVAFTIIIMATIASMGVRDRRLNIAAASGLGFFMIFGWIPKGITIAIMIILLGSFFIGGLKGGTD